MLENNIDGYPYEYDYLSLHETSNNRQNLISVVICSFFSPIELSFCLKVIDKCADGNVEFIVVDESDKFISNEIICDFKLPIKYIKLYKKSWNNKYLNFNIGIKYCKGNIIVLQSSLVIYVGNIFKFIRNNMEFNTYIQLPILRLKRIKDNRNLIYKLYNSKNNTIIRNIISKDRNLHTKKSLRYNLQYSDDDCNFILVLHKYNLTHSSLFDCDLDMVNGNIFNMFMYKLKCMYNINELIIPYTHKYNMNNYPYGIALYRTNIINNDNKNDDSDDSITDEVNDDEGTNNNSENITENSENSNSNKKNENFITIDVLNSENLLSIKREFYINKFKKISPFIRSHNYGNLIRYSIHKSDYNEDIHPNMDNYIKHLFDSILYDKETDSFFYALRDKLTSKQLNIISKTGITYSMYNHNVTNKEYKISFKCKSNIDTSRNKKISFYNTSKWISFPNKLTDEYQTYEYVFKWYGECSKPGEYENYFKIILSKLEPSDSFSIKDVCLIQI